MPKRLRRGIQAIGLMAAWCAGMGFLWAPWNGIAVGHGTFGHIRLYGVLGVIAEHHPARGAVTTRVDPPLLACNIVFTLALTAGHVRDGVRTWRRGASS